MSTPLRRPRDDGQDAAARKRNASRRAAACACLTDAKPISFATSGKGSLHHLVAESFAARFGLGMTHVPCRGGAPAMQDLAGSVVDILFAPKVPQYPQLMEAGRLKAIGIAAAQRSPVLPNVQAFGEISAL